MFTVATWNVNSLRVRLPHVLDWLSENKPDVLALQETKMPDAVFPKEAIQEVGYQVSYSGQPTYNGVAVLSKGPMKAVITDLPGMEDPQRRILGVTIDDCRIINCYVPNGESLDSPKYQYKLKWLEQLRIYVKQQLNEYSNLIVLGDFNIAPADLDVYNPKAWEGHVLVSEPERVALHKIMAEGLHDAFRLFDQESSGYSWWDYRMAGFRRNLGMRLDLVLISEALVKRIDSCRVDKGPRQLERPSDHAPVIVSLK